MKIYKIAQNQWIRVAIILVLVVGLFTTLTPVGIKYYLIHWLKQNGAESASIETLTFNPFLGRLTLGGVDIQSQQRSILHHSTLVVDVKMTSLFQRDFRVETAEYRDLFLDIEQTPDGNWRYGSYTLAGTSQAQELDPPGKQGPRWGFHADNVLIANCSVHLKTPQVDITLTLDQAELQRFTTMGEETATLELTGRIDEAPITVHLDTLRITPDIEVNGNIALTDFDLAELQSLLVEILPTLQGHFGTKGDFRFALSDAQGLAADYHGTINLNESDLATADIAAKATAIGWDGTVQYMVPTGQPASIATDGTISLADIQLDLAPAEVALNSREIEFNGKTALTLGDALSVSYEGNFSLAGVVVENPTLTLGQEQVSWQGKVDYVAETDGDLTTQGRMTLAGTDLQLADPANPLTVRGQEFSWEGDIALSLPESGAKAVTLDGGLVSAGFAASLPGSNLLLQHKHLAVNTTSSLALGEPLTIKARSGIKLSELSLQQGEGDEPLKLSLGQLAVADLVNTSTTGLSTSKMDFSNLAATLPGTMPLTVKLPALSLAGLATEDMATFSLAGLGFTQLEVQADHSTRQLATLQDAQLDDIAASATGDFRARHIDLKELVFLPPAADTSKAAVAVKQLGIDSPSWDQQQGLATGPLTIDELQVNVTRDSDGAINIARELAAAQRGDTAAPDTTDDTVEKPAAEQQAAAEPAASAGETGQAAPPIRIAEVSIGKNSHIAFSDQTMKVPYATDLAIETFVVKDLDSTQPDKPSKILLEGTVEQRAPIKLSGTVKPFADNMGLDLDLVLKNYPLKSLSPYTVQAIGTALAGGGLKLQTSLALADDKIDMKNAILLENLTTETIAPELAAELNNQLPVPLDAALAMMRDDDGNISLDIPISGPVDDINVGIASVVVTALNKAIVSAASSYFIYTLGPYAALAYVGMQVGEQMLQVTLPPVAFAPEAVELSAEHRDYLDRIATILTDRKDQDLRLTPHLWVGELYSEEERGKLKEFPKPEEQQLKQLKRLGSERVVAIISFLTKEKGIDKIRILVNDTVTETARDAQPTVAVEVK